MKSLTVMIAPLRGLQIALLGLLLGGQLAQAQADEGAGQFNVRAASAQLSDGVYYLTARVDYGLSQRAYQALQSGVPLTFEVQIELHRKRRFVPDAEVAKLLQRYRLQYHALSERYVTRNLNSGEQQTFATLNGALRSLGSIEDLPIIDATLLNPQKEYQLKVRALLDVKTFPGPLRLLAALFSDWRLASEWVAWTLSP